MITVTNAAESLEKPSDRPAAQRNETTLQALIHYEIRSCSGKFGGLKALKHTEKWPGQAKPSPVKADYSNSGTIKPKIGLHCLIAPPMVQ